MFEKLTDEKPGLTEPTPSLRSATVSELRESVVRHLEVLLNTRRSDADIDPAFEESNKSVLTYGVADFTSLLLANTFDREGLRRSMERSIRLFEPRLTHVELTMEEWKPAQFGLHFRISALLRVEPQNEPVLFDAVLAKDTRRFQVTGGRA